MKERLGEQPEEFYFDEASRMFVRRGDKPPRADRHAEPVEEEANAEPVKEEAKAERPQPGSISLMTTEELAELPEWLIPPSKKEEVERFKTRAKRQAEIEFDEKNFPSQPEPDQGYTPDIQPPRAIPNIVIIITKPTCSPASRGGRYSRTITA